VRDAETENTAADTFGILAGAPVPSNPHESAPTVHPVAEQPRGTPGIEVPESAEEIKQRADRDEGSKE
jgi:hypothetical protein